MDRKELDQLLDSFLEERKKGERGGWAPVTTEEMQQLSTILSNVIALKYEQDADGDVPIQFKLVDRTICWPLHFNAMLYEYKGTGGLTQEETVMLNLRRAVNNMATASRQVENCQQQLTELAEARKNK